MLGIMGAMNEEINLLRTQMAISQTCIIAKREFYVGTLFGLETVLVFSRYGKVSAATTAALLKVHFEIDALIFVGVAGSADLTVNIGDIVLAEQLIQHDMDCTPLFPKYEIPLLNETVFEANHTLLSGARVAANNYLKTGFSPDMIKNSAAFNMKSPKVHMGLVASGDQFIKDIAHARSIKTGVEVVSTSKLLAFEMEGGAVAQTCFELELPFIVIRTISDNADHGAPIDFPRFISDIAQHYSCGIVKELCSHIVLNDLMCEFDTTAKTGFLHA